MRQYGRPRYLSSHSAQRVRRILSCRARLLRRQPVTQSSPEPDRALLRRTWLRYAFALKERCAFGIARSGRRHRLRYSVRQRLNQIPIFCGRSCSARAMVLWMVSRPKSISAGSDTAERPVGSVIGRLSNPVMMPFLASGCPWHPHDGSSQPLSFYLLQRLPALCPVQHAAALET